MRYNCGDRPVPGYRLRHLLGKGGCGEVWKATGPGGFICATKIIKLNKHTGLSEFRTINLLKRIRHPNLVPIYGVWLKDLDGKIHEGTKPDTTILRAEAGTQLIFATGLGDKTLRDRLEECRVEGGIPIKELLEYTRDAAKGIDYLNAERRDTGGDPTAFIHCNIKPSNLLVVGESVQVGDYSVAMTLSRGMPMTRAGGTVAYASPELLNGDPSLQTDQYSLAITYYELRTGRLPFDVNRAMFANITGNLDFSELPAEEEQVLKRATDMQPARRYGKCQDMVSELQNVFNQKVQIHTALETPRIARRAPVQQVEVSTPADPHHLTTIPLPPSPPGWIGLPVPAQLGGYRLVAELGKGGMGVVFRGEDVRLGRAVAIKLILPEYANQPKTRARFLREAKSQANVASDHVVPIHHIGEEGEVPYIVMPLLNGETLEGRLKREPIPPLSTTLQVGLEVAMGLAAAHDRRLIHRDIKPSNIWLEANAAGAFHRCKILDFGLARPIDPAATPITVHHAILGTPAYMSPEQAGEDPIDHRTDLYSLGVVLYEMATGVQPFHSTNIVQTLIRVATARPGPAIDLNPTLPRELSDLIGRMMSRNVGERPQSAAEVVETLRGIAARCPR